MPPTVAIIGASSNRTKFGNKAVRAYARQGWAVYPVHPHADMIEGHRAFRSLRDIPLTTIDRVTIYLPPAVGLQVIEQIAAKPGREVWLNPGAESPALVQRARDLGLNVVLGCSIVAIGVDPHALDD
jgi:predicted CoA-binding protein